jgi:hypothetical protein
MAQNLSTLGKSFVIALPVILAVAYVYRPQLPRDAYQCAEQSEQISQSGEHRIELTVKVCGGIAFSNTFSLAIRSEQSNQQTTIFSYGGSSDPKLKWISDNVLLIELSDVSEIIYASRPCSTCADTLSDQ